MTNRRNPIKRLRRAGPSVQHPLPDVISNATPALEASTNLMQATPSSTQNVGYNSLPNATEQMLSANLPAQSSSIPPYGHVLAPVSSRRVVLDKCTSFRTLPREAQLMIWEKAVDLSPRNVPVGIMPQLGPGGFKFRTDIPIPEGFMACKDYYEAARKRYCLLDNRLKANDMFTVQHLSPNFWFDPAIDRFCPVQEWNTHNFKVGLKLFFQILQVSRIAINDYATDDAHHNGETWQKFFHKEGISNWSPYVKDIFYYITYQRLNTDVELSFVPNDGTSDEQWGFHFHRSHQLHKHWDQILDAKRGYRRLARLQADQKWQDKSIEREGKARVKLTDVPQWLFDVESDWSVAQPRLMIETRASETRFLSVLSMPMPQW
ncbi:uncharacterized protein EAE97_004600 [Botrytis byssoidea]|uniref:2EXR domain-containing protein n=1 Tax=Botrytis byssoidea TaxID=139641 RepID=A0A9P5IT99_9HELO|nr:uncharacterized protein EAE97_004600 [Botrytis byssoidea]KAF7947351.1 hypothetical protein EAE97_004600 [Botrytis byssoidea]